MTTGIALAMLGAALAILLSGVGSTMGVVKISNAANALLSKEPKHFSKLLILMLLPTSQSIYGLTVAFMTFVQVGLLGDGIIPLSTGTGLAILFLCLPVGIVGMISANLQGSAGVTAVNLYAKQNKMFGNCILIISASEVFALFGFLISILGVMFIIPYPYVPFAGGGDGYASTEAASYAFSCVCRCAQNLFIKAV